MSRLPSTATTGITAVPAARRGPKPNLRMRAHLLETGLEMLHGAGYSACGIQHIVDAAKIPKGSFYNYFASKEAFAGEAIDLYFGRHLPQLRALLGNQKIAPLRRLRRYFTALIRAFRAQGYARGCFLGNMSLEMADQSDVMRARLSAHFRVWSGLIAGCIADAQAQGAIQQRLPPARLAGFILNSWEGALVRMRAEKSAAPLHAFMRVVFGMILI